MLWYLSYPIKPVGKETYQDTKQKGLRWYWFLLQQRFDVVMPCWGLLGALGDETKQEHLLGMYISDLVHEQCDGLVVVGDGKRVRQSKSVQADIQLAVEKNRPILHFEDWTEEEIAKFSTRFPSTWMRPLGFTFVPRGRLE